MTPLRPKSHQTKLTKLISPHDKFVKYIPTPPISTRKGNGTRRGKLHSKRPVFRRNSSIAFLWLRGGVRLSNQHPRMDTIVLLGSALWGWRRRRTRTGGSVRARLVESPKESVVPPSVPGALKIAAVDSTRSIARADIASVTIHWREGENCYVTLNLQSGEKLTGLVACTDLDSIHTDLGF